MQEFDQEVPAARPVTEQCLYIVQCGLVDLSALRPFRGK
jgi:hypothetical protein